MTAQPKLPVPPVDYNALLREAWTRDRLIAYGALMRIVDEPLTIEQVYVAVLVGTPVPWARAGTRSGRYYTPKRTADAEEAMGWRLKEACRTPLEGPIALACVFFMPDLKAADDDNLRKIVADAGNGVSWLDDRQIVRGYQQVDLDAKNPRTLVAFCEVESTMDHRKAKGRKHV